LSEKAADESGAARKKILFPGADFAYQHKRMVLLGRQFHPDPHNVEVEQNDKARDEAHDKIEQVDAGRAAGKEYG
jgi:hypothetical protein